MNMRARSTINLTNRCDCSCVFCLRANGHRGSIYADDLWLEHEPSRAEILSDVLRRDLPAYRELVFCGFGEPTYRIDDALWLVDELKGRGIALPPVRINTNGHGSLITGRDITPELAGRTTCSPILPDGAPGALLRRHPAQRRRRQPGRLCWTSPVRPWPMSPRCA